MGVLHFKRLLRRLILRCLSLALLVCLIVLSLFGVAENPANPFPQDLADKAEKGDTDAMIALGKAYWNGDKVPLELGKGGYWVYSGGLEGATDRQMVSGNAYFSGTKLPK